MVIIKCAGIIEECVAMAVLKMHPMFAVVGAGVVDEDAMVGQTYMNPLMVGK